MSPAEITALRTAAKRNAGDPLTRFVLLWIVWEATRTRLLVIACRKRGWRMRDARTVLRESKISSGSSFGRAWRAVTGNRLEHLTGNAARVWKAFEKLEHVRHRIVHGFSKYDPEYLTVSADLVDAALDAVPHTLGAVRVSDGSAEGVFIGDPLQRFAGAPAGTAPQPIGELWTILAVKPVPEPKAKRPSLDGLKRMIRAFEQFQSKV